MLVSKPADLTRMWFFICCTLEWHWRVIVRPARCSRKRQTFSQWWCHREAWGRDEEMKKIDIPRTTVSLFQPTHKQSKACTVCVQQPKGMCVSLHLVTHHVSLRSWDPTWDRRSKERACWPMKEIIRLERILGIHDSFMAILWINEQLQLMRSLLLPR